MTHTNPAAAAVLRDIIDEFSAGDFMSVKTGTAWDELCAAAREALDTPSTPPDMAKLIEAHGKAVHEASCWVVSLTDNAKKKYAELEKVERQARADLDHAINWLIEQCGPGRHHFEARIKELESAIAAHTAPGLEMAIELLLIASHCGGEASAAMRGVIRLLRAELDKLAPATPTTLDDMIAEMPTKDQARVADRAKVLIEEEANRSSIFPKFDVNVPMPAGCATPPATPDRAADYAFGYSDEDIRIAEAIVDGLSNGNETYSEVDDKRPYLEAARAVRELLHKPAALTNLTRQALLFFEHMAGEGVFAELESGRIDPSDDLMVYAKIVGIVDSLDIFGNVTNHAMRALAATSDSHKSAVDVPILVDELRGFYNALSQSGTGDGAIEVRTITGSENEQTRLNLRAVLREAADTIEAIATPSGNHPVGASLEVVGISADVDSKRTLKLHFRAPVTDDDRKRLVDAINATSSNCHPAGTEYINEIGDAGQKYLRELAHDKAGFRMIDGPWLPATFRWEELFKRMVAASCPVPSNHLVAVDARSCTCHPDDNPPIPCARKYALTDCLAYRPAHQTTIVGSHSIERLLRGETVTTEHMTLLPASELMSGTFALGHTAADGEGK